MHHGNTRSLSAVATVEAIRQLKYELLPPFPHRPELEPSNYHMSGPLKDEDLAKIIKSRTRFLRNFDHNRKLSWQIGSRGL